MHKYTLPFLLILFSCGRKVPEVQLDAYQLEPGFKLDLVAAEPLLNAPVAMSFDDYGRIWVLEMPGYMADLDNTAETRPVGSIVILKDEDGDGRMDQRKVFLDHLVLPRAFARVYGGLLYAEPPKLWFVEIDHDRPGQRTLVDSLYATGGNVEHQPNGLLMNIDNWIYSANRMCAIGALMESGLKKKQRSGGNGASPTMTLAGFFTMTIPTSSRATGRCPTPCFRTRFLNPAMGCLNKFVPTSGCIPYGLRP
ncbi:MAG: hypothetical protein IPL65_01240 [Lewinellaceae bacterium]|nr:hypothetical protein [Lewinellaceae bacterium]